MHLCCPSQYPYRMGRVCQVRCKSDASEQMSNIGRFVGSIHTIGTFGEFGRIKTQLKCLVILNQTIRADLGVEADLRHLGPVEYDVTTRYFTRRTIII